MIAMRGAALWMRAAISSKSFCCNSRRAAASALSASSRAMADCASASAMNAFLDRGAQVSGAAHEYVGGLGPGEPEAEQHRGLDVAAGLFDMARGIGIRAADDIGDH